MKRFILVALVVAALSWFGGLRAGDALMTLAQDDDTIDQDGLPDIGDDGIVVTLLDVVK